MRIGVVGSGISGTGAAWLLSPVHEVDLFEADDRLGGHAHTHDVLLGGRIVPADTGFMVYNERTYPNLIRFFERLGIEHSSSDMSFSVQCPGEGIEWAGKGLDSVFAQRSNLASPAFLRMLVDIVRFSGMAERLLADDSLDSLTLGELLHREGLGKGFTDWYLIPMGSAIWSTPPGQMLGFPAKSFLRFCDNHGLLHITGKPQWRSVVGGSRTYVAEAARSISGTTRVSAPVERIERRPEGVVVQWPGGEELYDAVVIASHADQALGMLADPSDAEREILGAFGASPNDTVLHTDTSFLPSLERTHASWNYYSEAAEMTAGGLSLTYYLNRLQPLGVETPLLVTLNPVREPDPEHVIARIAYTHPLFSADAMAAQGRLAEIQGRRGTWFTGAWQRYGFHEDGLLSAVRVAEAIGAGLPWADELDASRTQVV
ncbi:MAG: NAD(P)/FAD-dependent oxidoreductase [Anaerosomatales bacterium]